MHLRAFGAVSLLLVLIGCASAGGGRPANVAQPEIAVQMSHDLFFGSGGTAAAPVEVLVHNRAGVPIEVSRIDVESFGMVEYRLIPARRYIRETVAPGQTKSFSLFTTAVAYVRNPREPLTLRAVVALSAAGAHWREVVSGGR